MNKQQRTMFIALGGMLMVVLVVILLLNMGQSGGDLTAMMPEQPMVTATPVPEPTEEPVDEEALGRQALLEEQGEEYEEWGEGEELAPEDGPID